MFCSITRCLASRSSACCLSCFSFHPLYSLHVSWQYRCRLLQYSHGVGSSFTLAHVFRCMHLSSHIFFLLNAHFLIRRTSEAPPSSVSALCSAPVCPGPFLRSRQSTAATLPSLYCMLLLQILVFLS